ncbi:MAG TPA: beta-L-arabinofuranosidase domain-containing protein [Protaetiibacter sp.]|nr:beta-L-arabinofuranosidase domain-containing protein [Protaetiibacter sp.]
MNDSPLPSVARARPAAPVAPSRGPRRALGLDEVRITGGLWGRWQRINAEAVIAHCLGWMERIGWVANFDRVAGTASGDHSGIEFVDSEVYKLLEAMAWELGRRPDATLEARYRALIARVAAAQDADGYLHTSFGHPGQRARYSDLEWGHELYCFGHLLQAAVARLRTGHDDVLVAVARRLADHLWLEFGPDGREAICGHAEVEVALVEFARATDDARYLELARLFIERRGHRTLRTTLFQGSDYFQDDVPVRNAEVLRGHAVRALYLSAGALDVAAETGDEQLADAVEAQYRRALDRRSYLTGGMGSHHQNEEFGDDYELPADRAYAETCAAIGSVMVAWRLLLRTGDPLYADQMERTLLNAVLVSPRDDGQAFYYANTLHQRTATHPNADDQLSERAEASMRAPWFEVSCCPTNVARTLASIAGYVATTDGAGVQLHQFVEGEVRVRLDAGELALRIETAYPHEGTVRVTVLEAPDAAVGISLRVPAWAAGATLDDGDQRTEVAPGAATVTRGFCAGEQLVLTLPLEPRVTWPHPRMDAVRGQLAVERGPLVLALEDVDLPDGVDVEHVELDAHAPPIATGDGAEVALRIRVDPDLPAVAAEDIRARLRPYKDWANRGPSTMRVWIPMAR